MEYRITEPDHACSTNCATCKCCTACRIIADHWWFGWATSAPRSTRVADGQTKGQRERPATPANFRVEAAEDQPGRRERKFPSRARPGAPRGARRCTPGPRTRGACFAFLASRLLCCTSLEYVLAVLRPFQHACEQAHAAHGPRGLEAPRNVHRKFANFSVAPSRPRNRGDQLPAPLFFISDFFRKVQKSRQFILGFKGEILILAKIKLPFRFLEPPPPGRAKNPNFTRLETRSTKFPHYLFDFSLGLSPRTFLPIKKHFFFNGGVRFLDLVPRNPNRFRKPEPVSDCSHSSPRGHAQERGILGARGIPGRGG